MQRVGLVAHEDEAAGDDRDGGKGVGQQRWVRREMGAQVGPELPP